jgi:alkaline phosphatase
MHNAIQYFLVITISLVTYTARAQNPAGATAKPKNIILMVGDGMGVAQIYAGLTANRDTLNLERFKCIGFSKTYSANRYITESAAGATAFAIGVKTHNGAIGVDANDEPHPTILEIARDNGLSTGLVATTDITDATPAAFVAHVPSRKMQQEIAADYVKSDVDIFIGAGKEHFDDRQDGRNLIEELKKKNYQVFYSAEDISKVKSGKIAGLLKERPATIRGNEEGKTAMTAIRVLNQNPKGFFLMIEGSKIDDGGHDNDVSIVFSEMQDFDQIIGQVLDFAEKDGETLVVVTADHETGGLTLTGGDLKTGKVEGKFTTEGHTAVMVPVFAYGPGAEAFMGIYNNNMIFHKLLQAYGFTK